MSPIHNECSICMDTIGKLESLTLDCGHVYHTLCIRKWKESNTSCPLCRYDPCVDTDLFGVQNMSDVEFSKLRAFFGV